jgi:transcriptional regulator with XRE-family HTH domain
MNNMGELITTQRKAKGMTQADLAEKMNVTDKAVSKWERNISSPDIGSIPQLAKVLDITVEELLSAKRHEASGGIEEIIGVILKAVPLAMGVAVVATSILNGIEPRSALIMLGIGLTCLSIGALNDRRK